jgi:hypothetical protein
VSSDTLVNVAWVAVLLCFVVFVVVLTSLQTMAWHLELATETLCGQADCALDGAMMRCMFLYPLLLWPVVTVFGAMMLGILWPTMVTLMALAGCWQDGCDNSFSTRDRTILAAFIG